MKAGAPKARVPYSAAPDIVWPALPQPDAARRLALLQQLDESQWWPPETLRAWQFRQLDLLLDHALKTVPFYSERLRAAGVREGKSVTPEIWSRIPVLSRNEVQGGGATLHSSAVPKGHGQVGKVSSSGSSGRPIEALTTRISQLFWDTLTVRDHLWHRRDFRGKLASIRNFPDGRGLYPRGLRARSWGPSLAAIYPTGPAVGLSILATTEQQIDWLRRENPDYLLVFPSVLEALVRWSRDNGVVFPRLREVRTISEVLSSTLRAACEAAWGVPVTDAYSAMEIGYIALQCPDVPAAYHVQPEAVHVEILRDDGTPCGPGETGQVVVTPLHNFAMPLIRYALGDYAEVGAPCDCGRGLPVVTRVLGRVRNMLVLPGGESVWPRLSEGRFREVAPIQQYQIVQTSLERLEMKLVCERPITPEEEARLSDILLARLGHSFDIAFSYHENIPRGPGGKFEDFKCEIEDA